MDLRASIAPLIKGDVQDDAETLRKFSRDTSIFERKPALVVSPKDANDVAALVRFASDSKAANSEISLTARAAGTDMSGGPLTYSIVVSFTKYMNRVLEVGGNADASSNTAYAVVEPGVYYRDLEKETLAKKGMILPPYPASREICALGGMIGDNSGGELTLRYGKMDRYVRELDVVLSDGSAATMRPLTVDELAKKKAEQSLEGNIYRQIDELIKNNRETIESSRPNVTKNSAGYALWNVVDAKKGTFDLTKLIVGSQGTLGLITRARVSLEKTKAHHAMLVVFLSDLTTLPEVVRRVRAFDPESFESYDDHTFKLAARYGYDFLKHQGLRQTIALAYAFLPEVWALATRKVPQLVLLAEFAEDTEEEAHEKTHKARAALSDLPVRTAIALGTMEKKYWKIRRESFALLRKHVHGLHAAPFIDDIVVHPDDYPRFIPELNALLGQFDLMHTIAGHIGDANFHIIPLVNLANPAHRKAIMELTPKVYELVGKYKGSITGEHNDGIIRTPYLNMMFSPKMLELFAETKRIFDPKNIFNPGKKVGCTTADIEKSMYRPVPQPANR
ncbi:MAG: FAD-binding oxidoreductase [bacterium]|nr:FAD-binding oxidoreductase [bacterium]